MDYVNEATRLWTADSQRRTLATAHYSHTAHYNHTAHSNHTAHCNQYGTRVFNQF